MLLALTELYPSLHVPGVLEQRIDTLSGNPNSLPRDSPWFMVHGSFIISFYFISFHGRIWAGSVSLANIPLSRVVTATAVGLADRVFMQPAELLLLGNWRHKHHRWEEVTCVIAGSRTGIKP